jgi:Family of unknown function (DUF5682)
VTESQVFGIRHHGPGSARALRAALMEFAPQVVLIEGPPEADSIVPLAADPQMCPPVALLAYTVQPTTGRQAAADSRNRSAFWPFAEFSPEWQAIRYANDAGIPARFCDLPAAHQLADDAAAEDTSDQVHVDPLGLLAEAAGYDDAERWWDDVIEHRGAGHRPETGTGSPFAAIAEAMAALREHAPVESLRERRREAHMRRVLRSTVREGHERVAVVCGAWHVPALTTSTPVGADDELLRGLPKAKVALTWVPWTHGRLASWSGYGAGVRSPGWYHHLFATQDRPVERWLTAAARLLRDEDLHVSSAHVIEAVRLAETLAVLRDRPLAGLDEVTEAARAVLCEGAELPLQLIQRRMVVGERLGAVPDRTPMVPLQRDLLDQQRAVRLKPSAVDQDHDLDLRKPIDLGRSRLLHRLRMLGITWGVPGPSRRSKGTFRESWTLLWRPEFDVELISASAWGTTVAAAATAIARARATGRRDRTGDDDTGDSGAVTLPELTGLVEDCLLADLGDALPSVMRALADRAAADTDVTHLMAALPALVRALRYGDVRGTGTDPLVIVVDGLVVRICVGLGPAANGLDDDAARELLGRIDGLQGALTLLGDEAHLARWQGTLLTLIDRADLHGLLAGRLTRLLLDAGRLDDVADRMARAVSVGEPASRAGAWVEGFLGGGGLLLLHDDALLGLVDAWIAGLPDEAFTDVLPLLRRTFGGYAPPERRAIGERVRHLDSRGGAAGRDDDDAVDQGRAAAAVSAVADILGWELV